MVTRFCVDFADAITNKCYIAFDSVTLFCSAIIIIFIYIIILNIFFMGKRRK